MLPMKAEYLRAYQVDQETRKRGGESESVRKVTSYRQTDVKIVRYFLLTTEPTLIPYICLIIHRVLLFTTVLNERAKRVMFSHLRKTKKKWEFDHDSDQTLSILTKFDSNVFQHENSVEYGDWKNFIRPNRFKMAIIL